MKYTVAVILVTVSMVATESPRPRQFLARQTAADNNQAYPARGWRPSGPEFNLPLRSQRQEQPPQPAASYGPPPQEYGPPPEATTETVTTTETVSETTTLEPQTENIKLKQRNERLRSSEKVQSVNPGQIYVVVPQRENLVYTAALTAAPVVSSSQQLQEPRLLPIQAVPAFAKIQETQPQPQPIFARFQVPQLAVAAVPASSASSTSVFTPFSASYVQVYQ